MFYQMLRESKSMIILATQLLKMVAEAEGDLEILIFQVASQIFLKTFLETHPFLVVEEIVEEKQIIVAQT